MRYKISCFGIIQFYSMKKIPLLSLVLGLSFSFCFSFCSSIRAFAQSQQEVSIEDSSFNNKTENGAGFGSPPYKTAVGVRMSPTAPVINSGFSIRQFIGDNQAIEGFISLGNPYGVGATFQLFQPLAVPNLFLFYGGGGYIGSFEKNTRLGLMGIVGLDYTFPDLPVNLSIDWKPELNFVNQVFFEPTAFALSIRYALPTRMK